MTSGLLSFDRFCSFDTDWPLLGSPLECMVQDGSQTLSPVAGQGEERGGEGRGDKPLPLKGMTSRLLCSFSFGTLPVPSSERGWKHAGQVSGQKSRALQSKRRGDLAPV